jgi:hypothetical protein
MTADRNLAARLLDELQTVALLVEHLAATAGAENDAAARALAATRRAVALAQQIKVDDHAKGAA